MNEASMTGEAAQAALPEGAGRAQDVYERLRDDLLALHLVPGERLSERNLERRLGASRTPIREALMRLEGEGLVQRGEGGLRVAPLDLDELLEVFELRIETEALAVRLACTRADHARLDALQARMDGVLADPSPDAWYAIGTDYHIELAALSGNRFVHRSVRDAVTRIARARWLMASSEAGRCAAHREHSAIVAMIRANRPDAAEAAIRAHIGIVRDALVAAMREEHRGWKARGVQMLIGER
ncbi:GntR family transcriptional regulator [Saliniramus sp.]|uniref:GntR family transcriptional regulator n=1 Tax=Saliniramus sp. TaxID=2986772 RepID=UPI002C6393C5|nr:GntR family transcriptional regulator [Saliniramus sp.]HMB12335.1 GntR family transcriptional regulator [Saliniramus sp.]